jgi:Xaa-Pro aminopeptidase
VELQKKLGIIREALAAHRLAAVRLRANDWFAWATCGGSNGVFMATERGVAEVVVTASAAVVMTDVIEEERIRAEEAPADLEVRAVPWAEPEERERQLRALIGDGPVASDTPADGEIGLPDELVAAKRRLLAEEIDRYRPLGRDTAAALTETLLQARPEATEHDMAGIGAAALWRRGIEPVLILVGGEARGPHYRHARPSATPIGRRVSIAFCGRRHGLVANLTRHAFMRAPTTAERADADAVAQVEAAAWDASRPGATLAQVFGAIVDAYAGVGHAGAERGHHQGGTTGYLSREVIASPTTRVHIETPVALAWNPSLPGAKIEDTIIRTADGIEIITVDPAWPTVAVLGRQRPDLLVMT